MSLPRAAALAAALLVAPPLGAQQYEMDLPDPAAPAATPAPERPAGGGGRTWPDSGLGRADKMAIQRALKTLGHYTGAIDGAFGGRTRAAIRAFQRTLPAEATGWLTEAQRATLHEQRMARGEAPDGPPVLEALGGLWGTSLFDCLGDGSYELGQTGANTFVWRPLADDAAPSALQAHITDESGVSLYATEGGRGLKVRVQDDGAKITVTPLGPAGSFGLDGGETLYRCR